MTRRRDLLRLAARAGWTATRTNGDHLKLTHPDAAMPIYTGSTPSDYRALRNALATLRRALPPEDKPVEAPPKPKRRPKSKQKPARQEIETAIDWQAPAQPTPRPRRALPGAPRLTMTRWP